MPGWKLQWNLVLLNSLTCGLEICVAAGITYVPPLLLEAGVEEQYMTMVLGIGPVLGLLFIPMIGSASDRCTGSYGRRRPFIMLFSLGVLLALFIIPHADVVAAHFSWGGRPLQVSLLILGVGLLDFCGQVCFTPLEALLSDLYQEEEACGRAFAMFSFMVSLGGCVGYLLPALDWSGGLLSAYLGGQEECLFAILTLIFTASVAVTMKASEEPPAPLEFVHEDSHGAALPHSCGHLFHCGPRPLGAGSLLRACWSVAPAVHRSYCSVPRVMRPLCLAQLCSWMAVMSFVLFYTDYMGEGLYEGVPSAAPGTASRQRYDEGVRMGSLGLFLQGATSTFFSLVMSRLVRVFGSRRVYLSSMVSFTVSALVICLSKSVVLVTAMSALTGFAYATLQTLPYTLTCHYHKQKEVYMPRNRSSNVSKNGIIITLDSVQLAEVDEEVGLNHKLGGANGHRYLTRDGCAPPPGQNGLVLSPPVLDDPGKRGVGLDFAILDSTFLLSQVFPTLFMGMIVQSTKSVTAYIASSAIIGLVAIYLANHIVFDKKDLMI